MMGVHKGSVMAESTAAAHFVAMQAYEETT